MSVFVLEAMDPNDPNDDGSEGWFPTFDDPLFDQDGRIAAAEDPGGIALPKDNETYRFRVVEYVRKEEIHG